MRLILLNQLISPKAIPAPLEGVIILYCFEDLTFGSLRGWPDPALFTKTRSAFWSTIPGMELPDGSPMEYFAWHQVAPQHRMEDIVKLPEDEWPPFHDLNSTAPLADVIEIWADTSPGDVLWTWFIVAELTRLGITMDRVSQCLINDGIFEQTDKDMWAKMVKATPDRRYPAHPISSEQQQVMAQNWKNAVLLSDPQNANALSKQASAPVLDLLPSRFPDPATGLTQVHNRLLAAATPEWRRMARVIGEAMVAGYDVQDRLGEGILHAELLALERFHSPLIEIKGEGAMRFCTLRLTEAGRDARDQKSG